VIRLSSRASLLDAIAHAKRVRVTAYILGSKSKLVAALESAAARGASVEVELERAPYNDAKNELARLNRSTMRELRRHGVAAQVTRPGDAPLHLKAAFVDSQVFLDDRNWPNNGDDTIVTTRAPRELKSIDGALKGESEPARAELTLHKGRALELEARMIDAAPAGSTIRCESETFGYSQVCGALKRRALQGERVELLVTRKKPEGNPAEARALSDLQAAGVDVKVTRSDEKIALTGTAGWVGSANATWASPEMLDWGVRIRDARTLAVLERQFDARWEHATAFVA
jgi:hypothetical protein